MWHALWNIVNELSPWLLLGAVVAGLMHLLVPAGSLKRLLQGRGGLLASVLVGIPLPLCSCSVIPVAIGLRKEGAGRAASLGFLISTPQTGVDSVFVSGAMLGWPFAMVKVIAALIMGLIGGGLAHVFAREDSETDAATAPAQAPTHESMSRRSLAALLHSVELIRSIWRWLVIGIVVSALITWLLPANQLSDLAGVSGVLAMLLTLMVSLPLYVCATASVPIAAALVSNGLPAGAAMVFLMAGPATNVATVGAVYRTFGTKTTGLYLVTMVVGSVMAGLLFDSVLPTQEVPSLTQHDHTSRLAVACSILMIGMIFWFAVEDIIRFRRRSQETAGDLKFRITGMNCENCAAGLEREFRNVAGVENATVTYATEEAAISGNPDPADISEVVSRNGFEAELVPIDNQLPGSGVTD